MMLAVEAAAEQNFSTCVCAKSSICLKEEHLQQFETLITMYTRQDQLQWDVELLRISSHQAVALWYKESTSCL